MNNQEEEGNIPLYIDELKSDDNCLKINAIQKLGLICDHLSLDRIQNELFPYLRYIIEEMDNDEEFLKEIPINILNVLKNKREIQKKSIMPILQILLQREDSIIRQKTLELLKFLLRENIDDIFSIVDFLSYQKENSCRVNSLRIIEIFIKDYYNILDDNNWNQIDQILLKTLRDVHIKVVRYTIKLIRLLFEQQFNKKNLQIYQRENLQYLVDLYQNDTQQGILFEIIQSLFMQALFKHITEEQINQITLWCLSKVQNTKQNWRTKYLVLNCECLYEQESIGLLQYFEIIEQCFKSKDIEVKASSVRALKFLLISIDDHNKMQEFWSIFEDFIKNTVMPCQNKYILPILLSKKKFEQKYMTESFVMFLDFFNYQDYFIYQKMEAMNFLDYFLNLLQNQESILYSKENLKPFTKTQLVKEDKHENSEEGLMQIKREKDALKKHEQMVAMIQEDDKGEIYSDLFKRLEYQKQNKNWRLRHSLLTQIQKIVINLDRQKNSIVIQKFFDLNLFFRDDLVLANRKQIVKNQTIFKGKIEEKFLKEQTLKLLQFWLEAKNYIYRIQFYQSLFTLNKGIIKVSDIEQILQKNRSHILNEKIVNVKINFMKMITQFYKDNKIKFLITQDVVERYIKDQDQDLQSYIELYLNKVEEDNQFNH